MRAIDLLPEELKINSLSRKEVILSYDDTQKAINIFKKNNWVILKWEGWVKYSEGQYDRSEKFRGISYILKDKKETWESYVKRSAKRCLETIKKSQQKWDINPEYPDSILFFCLIAEEKPKSQEDLSDYEEEYYFAYSATLRIFGDRIDNFDEINKNVGLMPTHTHKKGTPINVKRPGKLWNSDMWSYKIPVPEEEPLDVHIQTLWNKLKPHKEYLLSLKKHLKVDVFLGYRSNSDTAGFRIAPKSLEMFAELNISFEVSVIIAGRY
ncbi:hypothetical protein Psfp_02800 [Pelotomaculum sp. FP]|uniref:DUF4279 domain-containing protein n=1 Tax=Pelotomaculum sp. FP TaxID=261474 RepID=UPI00106574B9|nr:DUF4279 domain-containing protein [Pelotomaculum sp. FP]TEB14558.1 hypothetical protein Psfp_02800 [Pelotomaculum sp. FP]